MINLASRSPQKYTIYYTCFLAWLLGMVRAGLLISSKGVDPDLQDTLLWVCCKCFFFGCSYYSHLYNPEVYCSFRNVFIQHKVCMCLNSCDESTCLHLRRNILSPLWWQDLAVSPTSPGLSELSTKATADVTGLPGQASIPLESINMVSIYVYWSLPIWCCFCCCFSLVSSNWLFSSFEQPQDIKELKVL